MSETTAKSTKVGLLTLTAAVGALLVILVAEMVSAKPASAEITSSPPPVTVPESGFLTPSGYRDPWMYTGAYIQPGQSVEIKADPACTI